MLDLNSITQAAVTIASIIGAVLTIVHKVRVHHEDTATAIKEELKKLINEQTITLQNGNGKNGVVASKN